MKTILPESIHTIDQAKQFLADLYNNKEAWHPEDNPADCLEIDEETAMHLQMLLEHIYTFDFDPCEYYLSLIKTDDTYLG